MTNEYDPWYVCDDCPFETNSERNAHNHALEEGHWVVNVANVEEGP